MPNVYEYYSFKNPGNGVMSMDSKIVPRNTHHPKNTLLMVDILEPVIPPITPKSKADVYKVSRN